MTDTRSFDPGQDGLLATLDMRIVSASDSEVVVEWQIGPKHWQPMGIVHGGVYCAAVETACSIGATLSAQSRDPNMVAVGLDNHTSFVRATRGGLVRAVARPLTRGRTTQLWEAEIRGDDGQLLATGRLRLLCVPRDSALGGTGTPPTA
jgi:1,4-dihydroxy-2-naphthoyl-CoA hydrolase